MIQAFIKIYYKLFPTYKILETKHFDYHTADELLKQNDGKPEYQQWFLAKEEDSNSTFGVVFLCRKIRL